jgi:hypothetical protein
VKSLIAFLLEVLEDLGTQCSTSTIRDRQTVTARFEHEGLSFLSISLANFGKDLQKGLDQGFVTHDLFQGFAFTGGLPRFLGGFLELVFDRGTGRLLHQPDVTAIWAIRQFTLMASKIELPATERRQRSAFRNYVECEHDVKKATKRLEASYGPLALAFRRLSRLLWADLFSAVDGRIADNGTRISPKHGPGATADRLKGNKKYALVEWPRRLEEVFSSADHLIPNHRYYTYLDRIDIIEPGAERPVRIISVPKTLKTPRIIGIEPTAMQYMQQGLHVAIVEEIARLDNLAESKGLVPRLNSLIGWQSQVPNQDLARQGSIDSSLATLDLSEASDRVSNQLVREMLGPHPHLAEAVDACRSRKADVPGHGVIRLAKFASMGSALTFPIESMVFLTVVLVGIEQELNRRLTHHDIDLLVGRVRTYGDDIIVPAEYVHSVITCLEAFGLKVNVNKSYWNGKFRESCGREYYDGHDVSVAKVRSMLPADGTDVRKMHKWSPETVTSIVSTVSLRNQLYYVGLWNSARYLDNLLGEIIPLPTVSDTSSVLGRQSVLGYETQRLCKELHRPLVKGVKVRTKPSKNNIDGVPALLKCLAKRSDLPFADVRHLEYSGRPDAVTLKLGWAPPF